jgi:F-type H+-transporting ATPase subunit b
MAIAAWLFSLPAGSWASQQPEPAVGEHGPTGEQGGGEAAHAEGESLGAFLSRIGNFVLLAGGLYYLLRSPLGRYLDRRGQEIRADLHNAANLRAEAAARLAEIDQKLRALPGEIDVLKARGREEVAAEQLRIREAAEIERRRLVEQTSREIDRQLQIARRDLTEYAADLAVGVARGRLFRELGQEEQLRLVDRYSTQVGGRSE